MIRDDIFGMLNVALQKGKNLQQIIQTLYNAGYSKNEVDDAVKQVSNFSYSLPVRVQQPIIKPQLPPPRQPAIKGQTTQIASAYPASKVQQKVPYVPSPQYYSPQQFFPQSVVQKVSNYEQPTSSKEQIGKLMIIIMVIMLVILLGILVAVFLFKDELSSFINNL